MKTSNKRQKNKNEKALPEAPDIPASLQYSLLISSPFSSSWLVFLFFVARIASGESDLLESPQLKEPMYYTKSKEELWESLFEQLPGI